jgi:hypothetical protein
MEKKSERTRLLVALLIFTVLALLIFSQRWRCKFLHCWRCNFYIAGVVNFYIAGVVNFYRAGVVTHDRSIGSWYEKTFFQKILERPPSKAVGNVIRSLQRLRSSPKV